MLIARPGEREDEDGACRHARLSSEGECAATGMPPAVGFLFDTQFHDLKHKPLTDRQGKDAQELGTHSTANMTAHYIEDVDLEWIEPPTNPRRI